MKRNKKMPEEWRVRAEKVLDEVSETKGERAAILYFASTMSEFMKEHVPRELTLQTLKFLLSCVEEQMPKAEDTKRR